MLAERDPEEARKILDPVLEHMMEAVHRYEGTVNQVIGYKKGPPRADDSRAIIAPLANESTLSVVIRVC